MWESLVGRYLDALAGQGRRPHTLRGYGGDLGTLARCLDEGPDGLARWTTSLDELAPSTKARRLSAGRGFLRWATSQGAETSGLEPLSEPGAVARALSTRHRTLNTRHGSTQPRGAGSDGPLLGAPAGRAGTSAPDPLAVDAVLQAIPRAADRDHLLFKLMAWAGLRPGEVLALGLEDFDQKTDRLCVQGWGGALRWVLIDVPELQLRLVHWARSAGRPSGPMFCAEGRSTPMRYQSLLERWRRYTRGAGADIRLGDLRLHHAAALLAGGVPEWVVRERLGQPRGPLPRPQGHGAEEEIRAWRFRLEGAGQPGDGDGERQSAGPAQNAG